MSRLNPSPSVSTWHVLMRQTLFPAGLFLISAAPLLWDRELINLLKVMGPGITLGFRYTAAVLLWLSGAWFISRVLDVLLWDIAFVNRLGTPPPQLLKVMTRVVIAIITLTGVMSGVFDLPVTGLWATSGAVGLVLGLALQSIITDAFSGLAMNFDHAVSIGEWVKIYQRGLPVYTGKVIEMNWRTTRILTKDNTMVIFPNSLLSKVSFVNLSRPDVESRFKLEMLLSHNIPTDRAMRAIEVALFSISGVKHTPPPKVRVRGIAENGVRYQLRYWHDPRDLSPSKARSLIINEVITCLKNAGLSPATPLLLQQREMIDLSIDWRQMKDEILSRTQLLKSLPVEVLSDLADKLEIIEYSSGDQIVTEGDHGDSMFILVEGALEVFILQDDVELTVGQIRSGEFFGEHSLLTNKTRGASVRAITSAVCFELHREALAPHLAQQPQLVEVLSEALELRSNLTDERKYEFKSDQDQNSPQKNDFIMHIKSIFGISS